MNLEKIKAAVNLFLEGIGENVNREGLAETPDRVARMLSDFFSSSQEEGGNSRLVKSFTAVNNEIVLVKNISFCSICEHHLLPFFGCAHVAYVPNGKIIGISKIARIVDTFASGLNIQENLCEKIAQFLMEVITASGVIVMLKAMHTCMALRGVKKEQSTTVSLVKKGVFKTNIQLQNEFFSLIKD